MLVLTRKPNEAIHIGNGIILRVLNVTGSRVRIGIEAPPEVSVRRGELELELEPAALEAVGSD